MFDISTAQLNPLPGVHLLPIYALVLDPLKGFLAAQPGTAERRRSRARLLRGLGVRLGRHRATGRLPVTA